MCGSVRGTVVLAGGGRRKPALRKCFGHVMDNSEDDSVITPIPTNHEVGTAFPHFTNEETEAQRSQAACPGSHSESVEEPGLGPRSV